MMISDIPKCTGKRNISFREGIICSCQNFQSNLTKSPSSIWNRKSAQDFINILHSTHRKKSSRRLFSCLSMNDRHPSPPATLSHHSSCLPSHISLFVCNSLLPGALPKVGCVFPENYRATCSLGLRYSRILNTSDELIHIKQRTEEEEAKSVD